jgi:hypothetical protein
VNLMSSRRVSLRASLTLLTFRRANGNSRPVTELRYDAGSGCYVLERQ